MYWWEYLQTLREEGGSRPELVLSLLAKARKAVGQDEVWESSGLENLLERAEAKARSSVEGDRRAARAEGLQLLSFHLQRNVLVSATSSGSGELGNDMLGKLSSGSASPGSSDEDANPPYAGVSVVEPPPSPHRHTAKRRRDQGGSSATSVDHTQDAQKRSCSRPTAESQQQQQPSDAQQQQQQQPQQQKQQPQQPQQQGEQQEEFAVPRGVLPRRAALGASSLGRASLPHLGRSSNHPLHRDHSKTTQEPPPGGGGTAQQNNGSARQQPSSSVLNANRDASAAAQARGDSPRPGHQWHGTMHLHLEDFSSSELCEAQVALPACVGKHALPEKLVFTHIVQRRGVTLGKHQVCRTSVTKCTSEQAQSLHSMATNELVAVSSQDANAFILVPYLDSKQEVKLAGFLLQF